jgi:hypothetical protein
VDVLEVGDACRLFESKGKDRYQDYAAALTAWDSSEARDNGGQIQIQVSRSKRLLPATTHTTLDKAQQAVVDELDKQVETCGTEQTRQHGTSFAAAFTDPSAPRSTACFSGWTRS